MRVDRRDFIKACGGVGSSLAFFGNPAFAAQQVKPTWLSFGLNGPAAAETRFPMTSALMQKRSGKEDLQFQVSQQMAQLLRKEDGLVEFRDTVNFNDGVMIGAVLDYENILSAKLGTASFVVLHLVGHGVLLNFDQGRGWSMLSSFPFPVTMLRESGSKDSQEEVLKYLYEAFTSTQGSFATSFIKTARRVSSRWRDSGRGFNVRVMTAKFHPDVESKLASWKLTKHINEIWFGHLASAAACEGLGIPVVPFAENKALGKFTYKFSDRLIAQNVRLPEENDIDLRLHITLRNIGREVKFRNQLQRWEVNRLVVMEIRALDDRNEEVFGMRFGYQDEMPDTLAREEDLVPERDTHFFDMAIYRGLNSFFTALDRQDLPALTKLFVKADAEQLKRIEKFKRMYQKAI